MENYNILILQIRENLNKCRHILCLRVEKLHIVKATTLLNLSYRFSTISMKIPASHFADIDMIILRFILKGKIPRIANTIVNKYKAKNSQPSFKNYYEVTIIMSGVLTKK